MVYLDDIIIFSEDEREHLEKIKKLLIHILSFNIQFNYKKSEFFAKEIEFLGYLINEKGIKISKTKTDSITNFPTPRNKKNIQQFLGLASYFRKFIQNFSTIALPLYKLLREENEFQFLEKEKNAFESIKKALTNEPILKLPNFEKRFYLYTDASKFGLGGVLIQKFKNKEHVIAYTSRISNKFEQNYSAYELECLALVFCIKTWRCYLYGNEFTVFTDNSALTYIKRCKEPNSRMNRWLLYLSEFQFDIFHKKGKFNVVADAISRNPKEKFNLSIH